jgi:hypothetical protein
MFEKRFLSAVVEFGKLVEFSDCYSDIKNILNRNLSYNYTWICKVDYISGDWKQTRITRGKILKIKLFVDFLRMRGINKE